jgi:hypothetical protein
MYVAYRHTSIVQLLRRHAVMTRTHMFEFNWKLKGRWVSIVELRPTVVQYQFDGFLNQMRERLDGL